ncbi:MAG: hypothetical protein ABSG41_13320 [Bryobacteraceae bacterium]
MGHIFQQARCYPLRHSAALVSVDARGGASIAPAIALETGPCAVVNLTGANACRWSFTQDPRALQGANSATPRIASAFYIAPGFDIDLKLFDG